MQMIGTNNTSPPYRAGDREGIGAIVLELRKDFPDAKILLLAIFPRGVPGDPLRDKIAEVNKIIARLDDQRHVFYMDIGAKFLDEKGCSWRRPTDNLHPRRRADIWGETVQSNWPAHDTTSGSTDATNPQPRGVGVAWTCRVSLAGSLFPLRVRASHACACTRAAGRAGAESARTSDWSGMSRMVGARLSRACRTERPLSIGAIFRSTATALLDAPLFTSRDLSRSADVPVFQCGCRPRRAIHGPSLAEFSRAGLDDERCFDIGRFASAASCPIIILSVSVGCGDNSTDTTFGTVDHDRDLV
jgi:hypothetical protein